MATVILAVLILGVTFHVLYLGSIDHGTREKVVLAKVLRISLICSISILVALADANVGEAQRRPGTPRRVPPVKQEPKPQPTPESQPDDTTQTRDIETVKIDTNLVTVPVIATTSAGVYIPDLQQNELSISEDGVNQQVAFFSTVTAPFHVVLVLDTSASTQDKLRPIQQAAVAFVHQLQPGDRIKVISFDNQVRELGEFTNNKSTLEKAILSTTSGTGTKLYDAFELALSSVRAIEGRKAIVLFTDGVDWHSDEASFDSTLRWLDEEGVIVYPIRFETRAETERIAREQANEQSPQLPTLGTIRSTTPGTTPPTFPSDDPDSMPGARTTKKTGPFGLPLPVEILGRRQGRDPDTDRLPRQDRLPPPGQPRSRDQLPQPDARDTGTTGTTNPRGRRGDDPISGMLDQLYDKADSYLMELANKSGGRLLRADTLASLPDAFAQIAAELRTQYAIGYYPTNKQHDGTYRKLKVTTSRKDVIIRARPGYRAANGG